MLFTLLPALHESLYFALTCKAILRIGKPHILRALCAHYSPWDGCRLISLGDGTRRLDDLPAHLLTPSERAEIARAADGHGDASSEDEYGLSDFAAATYARVFHMDWRMARINAASLHAHALRHWRTDAPDVDAERFVALYGDGRRAPAPGRSGVHVLCNLDKGEHGGHTPVLDLGKS